jgi:hypothetical protein
MQWARDRDHQPRGTFYQARDSRFQGSQIKREYAAQDKQHGDKKSSRQHQQPIPEALMHLVLEFLAPL